ncbi:hypothetical protein NFI96_028015 [Prochilodus magdalenae]|nr:hypothetical protein NFI96_028015 [Prochilodus magdalenae]
MPVNFLPLPDLHETEDQLSLSGGSQSDAYSVGLNQETQSTEWTARWVTDLPANASCRESHLPAGDTVVHEMDVAARGPHQSFTEACDGEMALSDDEGEGSVHNMSNVLGKISLCPKWRAHLCPRSQQKGDLVKPRSCIAVPVYFSGSTLSLSLSPECTPPLLYRPLQEAGWEGVDETGLQDKPGQIPHLLTLRQKEDRYISSLQLQDRVYQSPDHNTADTPLQRGSADRWSNDWKEEKSREEKRREERRGEEKRREEKRREEKRRDERREEETRRKEKKRKEKKRKEKKREEKRREEKRREEERRREEKGREDKRGEEKRREEKRKEEKRREKRRREEKRRGEEKERDVEKERYRR